MSLSIWLSLVLLCLLGAMTPGPSLAVVLGRTWQGGRAAGLAAALAHGSAVGLYALLTVAGLAAVIATAPGVFVVIQFAAAGYLFYLASAVMRQGAAPPLAQATEARQGVGVAARDGFMIAFLNPKLAVFMLALFAPFISPDQNLTAKAVLVLTIAGIDALWYSLVVLVVVRTGLLNLLDRYTIWVSRSYSVILLLFALAVAGRALMRLL